MEQWEVNYFADQRDIYMKNLIIIVVAVYLLGYAAIRVLNAETWERDNQVYVIFPKSPIALYYLFRPVSYIDAKVTGMKFHIGPHTSE